MFSLTKDIFSDHHYQLDATSSTSSADYASLRSASIVFFASLVTLLSHASLGAWRRLAKALS
jgi:hypothetical protein